MSNPLQLLLNNKVVVFGTGKSATDFNSELWFSEVDCYIDNDEQKWQQSYDHCFAYQVCCHSFTDVPANNTT